MATCVEIVRPLRTCGAPATHELVSGEGGPLMHLCDEHAAFRRRALGDRVMPLVEGS